MEPGSRADAPFEPYPSRIADVIGTLIALLTLVVPVAAIAYFSSTPTPLQGPTVYPSSALRH
ncbi:MAG TPA: hypothetical protein IGS37_11130 [Synechococcales cyanobacterium M55_K2018_004]|nr:hypothetical protein [Synechococcales cyanobacterium M55_K2018_004]